MTLPVSSDPVLRIYLALTQYPILQSRIRARMRRELFERGIISPEAFDAELRQKAVESQIREGLHDPYSEESAETWELRLERIRRALTDFLFAYNLPYEEFERIVREALSERNGEQTDFVWFNPELAPQDMLFEQAEYIEALPPAECERLEARLQEIKVVLIRTMVSDHLAYLKIARQWFTVDDLKEIRRRKIGGGKVGGKAAGMLLALRILQEAAPDDVRQAFRAPVSYYLGSDVFYNFMSLNGLMHWNDQKYKPEAQMRAEYPLIVEDFSKGHFPPAVLERLREVVEDAGDRPLIVRSSSLLEDNFGTSFAGKYDSIFCPNQAGPKANLRALTAAITRVYASVLNPDALLYRHHKGLADYDERIAILIQLVEGQRFGRYFLPQGAGVAFSRNLYRWSPQIRKDDGFLRLVWGLGTRAVDQTGNDYPRLVALSHPTLHPAADVKSIRRYSQQFVDLIDLEENAFITLPVKEVLSSQYPTLRYMAQMEDDGYLSTLHTNLVEADKLVVTFDELLRRTSFAEHMRTALNVLSTHYHSAVDTEFTLEIPNPHEAHPQVKITLLQCRPQSHIQESDDARLPEELPEADTILATRRMVPQGSVRGIRYVVFVSPDEYFSLPSQAERDKLVRAIGALNAALAGQIFICVGPGRWGTSTPNLGVGVRYGDIYNARALVELSGSEIGTSPEPSFGTHFFQDMMEAHIYPLAVFLDDEDAVFRQDFFYETPNRLSEWVNVEETTQRVLRLISVEDYRPGHTLTLIMDGNQGRAAAFVQPNE